MRLTQALHKAKQECPERTATVCGSRRQTYAQLHDRTARLAAGLRALGVQPGDRVGVLSGNTDRFVETYYAVWWLGAIINPVNVRLSAEEVGFVLEDSDTRVLLVDDPFLPLLNAARQRTGVLRHVIYLGSDHLPDGLVDGRSLVTGAEPAEDVGHGDGKPAALFYTGGTTGRAKGVVLTHAGLYATTLASSCVASREPGVACLHALPMFHVGGLAVVLQAMTYADTQIMLPAFDIGKFLELIENERVVEAALVPTMIKRLVDHPELGQRDLSSLKRLFYGASPIDATLLEQTIARFPGVALTQFYGMTETAGIITALPPPCHGADARAKGQHRAAGRPIPCVELRILGAGGQEAAPGVVGEILVRGPGVMQGYWNRAEETQKALVDGWMHTGDGGYLDTDGLLFIVDRLKDVIVSGGENVYSVEVENAILALDGIDQCAVVGVPDDDWGERVHAAVVLRPGAEVDAARIIQHCKGLIAGYKCPRSVEFRTEMPVSGAGKLLKYKLREPFWAQRSRSIA
ncbi:MAG: long-chain-fatty-acid--CoA ligase [Proteobacteria bacterium]|nr:long-chain-fatty-acid--CoA ligase [Pseudomonadota bacterium]